MKIKLLDKYCMTRKEVSYTYESINLEGTRVVKRAAENLLTLGDDDDNDNDNDDTHKDK